MLQEGKLGVHPPGALGVGFFVHAQAESLIGRGGDGITDELKKTGMLKLIEDGSPRAVSLKNRIFGNILEAEALGQLPELLFVCCNPDQLGLLTGETVRFLENLAERGKLRDLDDIRHRVPILLVLPNGILSEQTLQTYDEQLHESLLMQRLPGVTEEMVGALLDRVVRGVSLQAGGRRGAGADTVYVLERKGALVFAGGGDYERDRIESILRAHDYAFTHARGVPGTRIEFDKAMISIVLNVGGLIHTVKPNGEVIDLRMGDLCKDPSKAEFVSTIVRAVYDVGVAAGAYPEDSDFNEIWAGHLAVIRKHAGHVTSSLKTFRDALLRGLSSVKLFSNEEWLLTPLSRYAANAGLNKEEELFKKLRRDVQASMARAIRYREKEAQDGESGDAHMKLTSQRSINIELYESGPDDIVLIGTMLDQEHLIKLEVTIYVPDEQITRSRLSMIRVPFPVCREVENVAERLVGLRIERGVLTEISRRLGGRVGCSHIKELATNLVYFVASSLVRRRAGVDPMSADYVMKPPEERFTLTKQLLRDSCLAYCQTTPQGLDEQIGIKRVGEEHTSPIPLGDYDASLGVLLRDRAARWGDKTFLRYRKGDGEESVTWRDFESKVGWIARHLIAMGVEPENRIAMLSENRAEMFMFDMAAMSIGAVMIPIFAGYPQPQVAYVLGHSRPRFAVVSGMHQLEKIEKDKNPWVEKFFCMDFDDSCRTWGAEPFDALLVEGGASEEDWDQCITRVAPDDMCMIMYTSGTTGPPKGVRLSHRNIISQQKAMELIWDVTDQDVLMCYLPWHHSFGGLFERTMALYNGTELCLDDSRGRDIDRLIENWGIFRPTMYFSVPRVHDLLMSRCRERREVADLVFGDGRLRFVFTAGASLPAAVAQTYREMNVPVLEGWGLTEASPCCSVTNRDSGWQSGCVGFPMPGITIRIDSDQEILVKGPNVMAGYLDDEEATSRVIDDDGWLHSGDLGEFGSDGLRLVGRKDGAFKLTTGEKVHPQRVETVLVNESPYIGQAVAVGKGEDFVGALIYPDPNRISEWAEQHGVTGGSLIDHPAVRELFASELVRINPLIEVKYQRVRRAVLADQDPSFNTGELTPSGKLVRKVVGRLYKDKIDAMYQDELADDVIEVEQPHLQRTMS